MASWLVCLSPDQVVWFCALAGDMCCVLGQDTHSAFLHPGVRMDTSKFNAGDNLAMD